MIRFILFSSIVTFIPFNHENNDCVNIDLQYVISKINIQKIFNVVIRSPILGIGQTKTRTDRRRVFLIDVLVIVLNNK